MSAGGRDVSDERRKCIQAQRRARGILRRPTTWPIVSRPLGAGLLVGGDFGLARARFVLDKSFRRPDSLGRRAGEFLSVDEFWLARARSVGHLDD